MRRCPKKIDTPISRKELQAAHATELQRKKEAHHAELDRSVIRNVWDPVSQAAANGHNVFQWQMQDHGKLTEEDWNYIIQKINTLFPDCDIHTISFEESSALKNPVNTIRWN